MAKHKLSEGGFSLMAAGTYIFKVVKVEYDEDFGKLEITLQTKSGQTTKETFSLINQKGEVNEGANKAFSYFAKTCLNNFSLEEIDDQDLIGCYIKATVKHEEYTGTKGKNAGKAMKAARLHDWDVAIGFDGVQAQEATDAGDDLDDFLDD